MAVNSMLSALIREVDTLDPVLVENVWALAERCGDVETMLAVLSRREALPDLVWAAARARKETQVRIAFLSRTDLPEEERAELLEGEKRSDVFAGLIKLAKSRPELAERLYKQFQAKPTKVLARVLLREDFAFGDTPWLALLALATEKSPSQPLERKMEDVIVDNSADPERVAVMLEVLPDRFLSALTIEKITGDNLITLADRLRTVAVAPYDRWDHVGRRRNAEAARALVRLASRQELPDQVVAMLDVLSGNASFAYADEVAALLAARLACQSTTVDDRAVAAASAKGKALSDLFELASTGDTNQVQPIVQGLLENPQAWKHKRFESLVRSAKPVSLIRAMRNTESPDLLAAIWSAKMASTPAECWEAVDDVEAVQQEILRREIEDASNGSPYGSRQSRVASLFEHRSSKTLVAALPFAWLDMSGYNRWMSASLLRTCAQQLSELQLEILGSDSSAWENFNNLASGWSGTLGELLEAARAL